MSLVASSTDWDAPPGARMGAVATGAPNAGAPGAAGKPGGGSPAPGAPGAPGRKRRLLRAAGVVGPGTGPVTVGATTGATVGAGTASGGTVLLTGATTAGLPVAGLAELAVTGAVVTAGALVTTTLEAVVPVLLGLVSDSPRTARRRISSRSAVSEASPSLVAGVWAIRPRHVESSISSVVFTMI